MTAFNPITPREAIAFVAAAGIADAPRVISDYAAAGLMKTYAMVIETRPFEGEPTVVRGAAVPVPLWQRIILEGVLDDVWTGGTVRLASAGLKEGTPAVNITAIGFNEGSLRGMVAYHRAGKVVERLAVREVAAAGPANEPADREPSRMRPRRARRDDVPPIRLGDLLATVAQAEQALGYGRTKINELMNDGTLEKVKDGGAVRITVASIRALASSR